VSDAVHPPTPASVVAVVLHWGEPATTAACLRSLLAGATDGLSILVVDSGAGADWTALDPRGRIGVLHTARNEGYAGGNNLALRTAGERGATYAVLVNNDAEVAPDALARLMRCAAGDARIAVVGSRLQARGDPAQGSGGHGRLTYGPFLVAIDGDDAADGGGARDVDWVSGCCVLLRLSALQEIGLLDPEFFLYCEDVDWCLRARRRGYRVVYEPGAVVVHSPPASLAAICRRSYFLARNGLLFARKHGTLGERVKISAAAMVLPAASLIRRLVAREPLIASAWVARGVIDGFLGRPPRLRELGLR
jgi:GT2 family glycosyltransferase